MSYLVMECHQTYVVVLDQQGRFLKTANLGYEVGQELEDVIVLHAPRRVRPGWRKQLSVFGALAACLCLIVLGSWQMLLNPQGTVRMQINPDVMMWVNRLNYVVKLEGVNEDGRVLAEGVCTFGKKVDILSDELAERAVELGYLKERGTIILTVESDNEEWKTATQELLVLELKVHLPQTVQITADLDPESDNSQEPVHTVIIPTAPDEWSDDRVDPEVDDWDDEDDSDDGDGDDDGDIFDAQSNDDDLDDSREDDLEDESDDDDLMDMKDDDSEDDSTDESNDSDDS